MSTTSNNSNCDSPEVSHIEAMDSSTESNASSETSTGTATPTLSAGLPLPPELRLMVYEYIPKIVYRPLPILHRGENFIYWPYIGMPSAPACSSRQLHSELQAYLAEVRRNSDLPDIIVRGSLSLPLFRFLSDISEVAKMENVGVQERQEKLLSRLLLRFARHGEPIEGPKNLPQLHGSAARPFITPAQGNAHAPLYMGQPELNLLLYIFDVELLHNFVCALVTRLGVSGNEQVHLRLVVDDFWFSSRPLLRSFASALDIVWDRYKVKISVARAGGFNGEHMKEIERVFPANTLSRIDWREATEEELALNNGGSDFNPLRWPQ
jgi:hypothetical protein